MQPVAAEYISALDVMAAVATGGKTEGMQDSCGLLQDIYVYTAR